MRKIIAILRNITNKLKFFGEYKNGKIWNGKGYKINNDEIEYEIIDGNGKYKVYISSYLEFDGYLVNGEINGNGKIYYSNGNLNFEGEYINGIKNGFGKEYYYNGNIKFEGIYKDDMEWEGKGFNINGELVYEITNGKGEIKQYTDVGNLEFEGKILKGKINGYGKELYQFIAFEGFYKNGEKNGYGKEYISGKLIYEREFLNGKKNKTQIKEI